MRAPCSVSTTSPDRRAGLGLGLTSALGLLAVAACQPAAPAPTPTVVPEATAQGPGTPRLIVQITVDQLRGDLPRRILDRLEPGGLRDLYTRGIDYTNAHYAHANTETIVGHATLATGALPAVHGMIGNVWLDRASGELTYNIEDPDYPLLTPGAGVDANTEIDPTQKAAKSQGRSPRAIRVSTFADELTIHTQGEAKVFAVSVKDRGAVALAGHTGKAFWWSKSGGQFVTSSYYYDRAPAWLDAWNEAQPHLAYAGHSWELSRPPADYTAVDDQAWEVDFPGYGRVFPHPYGDASGKYFTTLLTLSPAGDELTIDLAETLLEREGLGLDEVPDFLSVSLSSTDYVGHLFGPGSREAEDNLLRLDRSLARLFAAIDAQVGLEHTLIVLSADHGGPEVPGALTELGLAVDYIDPSGWNRAPGLAALEAEYGLSGALILNYFHPYIYLDREAIAAADLDLGEVAAAVAAQVAKLDGVNAAVTSEDLTHGRVPDTTLIRSILANHDPERSGDIYVVFDPHRFINEMDGLTVAATHGSPWSYDTFVPILVAGPGIRAQQVHRRVAPTAIASTLATYLGFKPPSGAVGDLLTEALERPEPPLPRLRSLLLMPGAAPLAPR